MPKNSLELRIPPVAVLLMFAVAMWAIAQVVPSLNVTRAARLWVAIPLGLAGLLIVLAGVIEFRRARTTVHPQKPDASSSVVRSGIYRHSRNPMYLGMLLVLLAWGGWLANIAALALAVLVVPYLNRFQIQPEERALARNFGAAYAAYAREVRRWL